jgi:hypothetical protein
MGALARILMRSFLFSNVTLNALVVVLQIVIEAIETKAEFDAYYGSFLIAF